ncbi:uncharacterized protein LOC106639035 [Copidosoma floridanum]|uniref:uncharacterized protein LOC106639035 n=1 Tax=Copidosoma floridanum TaxID=29053 RepID=UPI0006C9A09B|nr:uncharacterized protein LOC106639035 [Copidosoma floridanum]
MRNSEQKFSLSNDRAAALELLRLQEAAQLANDQLASRLEFKRNKKLSHIVHALFHLAQFITALTDEVFHHVHHSINRKMRESNPAIPEVPEERNPVFYVYPVCMAISFFFGILWLTTKIFNRKPIIVLLGNGLGGLMMITGGIWAMRHAGKHINLNEVSDEELLTHPTFIHNFVMCIISICGMIFYFIPAWILYDAHKWDKNSKQQTNTSPNSRKKCKCNPSTNHSPIHESRKSSPARLQVTNKNVQDEPVILHCCCIDYYRYLKSSSYPENLAHEFVVIQVM